MPRRKTSAVDTQIIALATQFGIAVAQAVRQNIAAEVAKIIEGRYGGARATATHRQSTNGRLRRGSVNESVLSQLLSVIEKSPGLRSEQIYEKVSLSPKLAKAGLAKLREKKQVKITGNKRAATYRVA